jgi:hypothetical protein
MKTIFATILIVFFCIFFSSCGKRDMYSNYDRVDNLFNKVKNDSTYKAFYDLVLINSGIIINNSKKSGKSDTAILNNRELSLKEKYEKLNYSDYSTYESNTMQQYTLITRLISKYPEFRTLTESESKKLVLLSNKYYKKSKKQ